MHVGFFTFAFVVGYHRHNEQHILLTFQINSLLRIDIKFCNFPYILADLSSFAVAFMIEN